MQDTSPKTPNRLPLFIKSGFGFAEIGMTAVQIITQLYLLEFYTQVVGLNASLAGLALAISVVWDAISDPIMGAISDNTQSRWGRRRPYIFIGTIFLAFSIAVLFSPPKIQEQSILFSYLLLTYIVLNTAMTIVSVPHLALGGELSNEPKDRTEIFGWRLLFSNVGIIIGIILPAVILQSLGDESNKENIIEARKISSWIIGLLVLFAGLATFAITGSTKIARKVYLTNKDTMSLGNSIKSFSQVLANKIFLPLYLAFVIATFGRTFNTAIALFYYKFRLGLTESDVVLRILFPFFIIIIISIPLWIWLSNRYGKKLPAFYGILILGLITIIAYPLYPFGNPNFPLITVFIGGICAGSIFILDSLVADIVDYDELKTGVSKEGLYFGFWKLGTKLAQAIALGISGVMLDAIEFVQGSPIQSEEVGFRLAMVFGPLVGVFFVMGAFVFLTMPLTNDNQKRIRSLLEKKRTRHKNLLNISQ